MCVCVCVCRGRGDILPLRVEGLCHRRLLFLHHHHPPRRGAGVSPGRKFAVGQRPAWRQRGKALHKEYTEYFQRVHLIEGRERPKREYEGMQHKSNLGRAEGKHLFICLFSNQFSGCLITSNFYLYALDYLLSHFSVHLIIN